VTADVFTSTGPLTTDAALDESALLSGDEAAAAEWLAYVGLGGRYAAVQHHRFWRRWTGRCWVACEVEEVHAAVRRVLGSVYDQRMEADPTPTEVMLLQRLMDLNWRLGPLMAALRRTVIVPADRLS